MTKHILYLASGSSRRFGSNKLLHKLSGKPMYLWGLETLIEVVRSAPDCDLTVVSRYEAIRESAAALGVRAVDSPESEKGISYTIRTGLSSLGSVAQEDFILFVVADQPYLTADTMRRLIAEAKHGNECASLCCDGRPGNPTLFSAALLPELMALEGDTGGRAVLKKHDCRFVPADAKELLDIDTK